MSHKMSFGWPFSHRKTQKDAPDELKRIMREVPQIGTSFALM